MKNINLSESELDKNIYRYLDFFRVIEMFKKNEMVFIHPSLWDDPFENYALNTEITLPEGNTTSSQYSNSIYCQCWTIKSVSDAMWRLYSPHKMSVRIKTTPRILKEVISNGINNTEREPFIGKINYSSQKAILDKSKTLSDQLITYKAKEASVESLLLKRNSFSHEKEIRTLIIDENNNSNNGLLRIKIDPHKLIKGILIDSRAPLEIFDLYKTYLKKELKFNGSIGQSSLYRKKNTIKIKL